MRSVSSLELRLLRFSIAIVYIWFGALKIFDLSPAHDLVVRTITHFFPPSFVPVLGFWEVLIGACFLHRRLLPLGVALFAMHVPGTMTPLVVLQDLSFIQFPFVPSLVGQYIVKNLVLIAAVIAIAKAVILDGRFPLAGTRHARVLRLRLAYPHQRAA
ncbi:MAG TPA: hypothetical protein VM598_09165 [Bdellovibrionota bacterium]|nr:hypothetical protein [Bdellovibrionota bacterium]